MNNRIKTFTAVALISVAAVSFGSSANAQEIYVAPDYDQTMYALSYADGYSALFESRAYVPYNGYYEEGGYRGLTTRQLANERKDAAHKAW